MKKNNIKIDDMSKDEYLMNRYGEEIKRFVYIPTMNWDKADDITQQTFIEVYHELD